MASVLAIVSKAVFEKAVPKSVKPGDLFETSAYHSRPKAFSALAGGTDAIYLVTARPGDVLWLVAILEAPKETADAWTARANRTPIRDISAAIPELKFQTGAGLAPRPGALGMSLQTPRVLTAADEALLRVGEPQGAAETYAEQVRELSGDAQAYAAKLAKASKAGTGLRLDGYRTRTTWAKLDAAEKKQLKALRDEVTAAEENGGIEAMDVIDERTSKPVYQLYLWPFGDGVLMKGGTTKVVATVVQHGFDPDPPDPKLSEQMAAAYSAAGKRLTIREMVDFTPATNKASPKPASVGKGGSLAEQIAALRARVAGGETVASDEIDAYF
ncbi:MAG: hypothetical protein ABI551_18985, partial [Polyangiaceae bacterium]